MGTSSLRMQIDACFTILTKKEFLEGQIQGEKSKYNRKNLLHITNNVIVVNWRVFFNTFFLKLGTGLKIPLKREFMGSFLTF